MNFETKIGLQTAGAVSLIGVSAAAGAIYGSLGGPIGAGAGALIGAATGLATTVVDQVSQVIFQDFQAVRGIASSIAGFFATTGVAMWITQQLGISLTFAGSMALVGNIAGIALGLMLGVAVVGTVVVGAIMITKPELIKGLMAQLNLQLDPSAPAT